MALDKQFETPSGNQIAVTLEVDFTIIKNSPYSDVTYYKSKSSCRFVKLTFNDQIIEPDYRNDAFPIVINFLSPEGNLKLVVTNSDISLYLDGLELRMIFPDNHFDELNKTLVLSLFTGSGLIIKGVTSLLGFYPMSNVYLAWGFIIVGLIYYYIDFFFNRIPLRIIPIITIIHHTIIIYYFTYSIYYFMSFFLINRDLSLSMDQLDISFSGSKVEMFAFMFGFIAFLSAMFFRIKMFLLSFYLRKSSIRYSTDTN